MDKYIFDIETNIGYARYYRNIEPHRQIDRWFCTVDYAVYDEDTLRADFGYDSAEAIAESGQYIPFVQVDILELKKRYLTVFHPELARKFHYEDFDRDFNILIERINDNWGWYEYEWAELRKAVIQWCKENGIAYR